MVAKHSGLQRKRCHVRNFSTIADTIIPSVNNHWYGDSFWMCLPTGVTDDPMLVVLQPGWYWVNIFHRCMRGSNITRHPAFDSAKSFYSASGRRAMPCFQVSGLMSSLPLDIEYAAIYMARISFQQDPWPTTMAYGGSKERIQSTKTCLPLFHFSEKP